MRERNKIFFCVVSLAVFLLVHFFTASYFLTKLSKSTNVFSEYEVGNLVVKPSHQRYEKEKLAVIVPFRDCFRELFMFAPHMHKFLNAQNIPHHIFIINQNDYYRFNRASLINVGYLYTRKHFDYIAIHDIDLLPLNQNLSYGFPKDGVFHVATSELHPKEKYSSYLGGIVIVSNKDFKKVHGMSNDYWGWGLEDDEFRTNLVFNRIKVNSPEGITTGRNGTFLDIHDSNERIRDKKKCYNQTRQFIRRRKNGGIGRTKFRIKSIQDHMIDFAPITILNVQLYCNKTRTPWCQC